MSAQQGHAVISLAIILGIVAFGMYLVMHFYEGYRLRKIPEVHRTVWLEKHGFQKFLGHLAMMGGLGHLCLWFLVAPYRPAKLSMMALLLFIIGTLRFYVAAQVTQRQKARNPFS